MPADELTPPVCELIHLLAELAVEEFISDESNPAEGDDDAEVSC